MELVFLTALGIGGATVAGALLGFIFKNISHRFSDLVLAFAAGVMLCAAIIGLILPSLEYGGGKDGLLMTVAGVFCGAFCLNLLDKVTPHMHRIAGVDYEEHPEKFHLYDVDEYIELAIDYIERIPQSVVIERFISQSPRSLLIAPDWGLKNYQFVDRLCRRMVERDTWQGRLLSD